MCTLSKKLKLEESNHTTIFSIISTRSRELEPLRPLCVDSSKSCYKLLNKVEKMNYLLHELPWTRKLRIALDSRSPHTFEQMRKKYVYILHGKSKLQHQNGMMIKEPGRSERMELFFLPFQRRRTHGAAMDCIEKKTEREVQQHKENSENDVFLSRMLSFVQHFVFSLLTANYLLFSLCAI